MYLYHYFDKRTGPFKSLTMLPDDQAIEVLEKVKAERPDSFCAQRNETYITKRKNCEALLRREFTAKGGIVEISSPYYLVVEHSPWLYMV